MLSSFAAAAVRGTRSLASNPDIWVPLVLTVAIAAAWGMR
jgi:hypothetical protein